MDYRTKNFQEKFASASAALGVPPTEIVSVKLRDLVNSYSEYDAFFHELEHRHRFSLTSVPGRFQGKGHVLTHGRSTLLLVQHESGLEILGAAGSVASLVGLVPLIVQAWRAFRRQRHHGRPETHPIEIRRLDPAGNLIEEHEHPMEELSPGRDDIPSFPFVVLLESELHRLRTEVSKLTERVQALEAIRKSRKRTTTAGEKRTKSCGSA